MLPGPLNKKRYSLPKCHGYIKLKGDGPYSKHWIRIGDYSTIALTNEFETEDLYGNDAPTRELRDRWLVQKSGTLALGIKQPTPLFMSIIYLTDPNSYFTQQAIPAGDVLIEDIGENEAVTLGGLEGIITGVTGVDEDETPYIAGTHYVYDEASDIFEIVKHPDAVAAIGGRSDVVVTRSAPEITAAQKRFGGGILQLDDGVEAELMFNQIGRGMNLRITLNSVKFLNSEEIPIGSDESAPIAFSLSGSLSPDASKPDGYRWGEVIELRRAA